MPVTTTKLGPGTFTLGPAGTPLDFSCQLVSMTVETDKSKDDDETTLCGDVVAGDTTYTATLSGEFFQDLADPAGIVAYSWDNMGVAVEFIYTPNTAAAGSVEGLVTVDPLPIGGDEPKAKMRSEFTWDCVGVPTFTPGVGPVTADAELGDVA